MDKSLQKRIASNKKAWALFEQNTALKNLYNSAAHEGNTNTFDHIGHPRSCPPYPFQWKDYTNDEKVKEGFVEVAKKTLYIKIRFKKEDEHIDDVCNICDERDTASMITCMKCSTHSCSKCYLSNKDSFISINRELDEEDANKDEDYMICQQCSEEFVE